MVCTRDRMLLLQKKKYAAVKVQFKVRTPYEVIERKGLDIVRRDWSQLSKDIGDFCLNQNLSGGSCEDDVESIHSCLRKLEAKSRISVEKELAKIRPMVDLASSTLQKIRNRCAYGWVQLRDLVITL